MLPFACVRGKLLFAEGQTLEVSLQSLSPLGFSFRIPRSGYDIQGLTCVEITFHAPHDEMRDIRFSRQAFQMRQVGDTPECITWQLETQDPAFRQATQMFIAAYNQYIRMRTEEDISDVAAHFLGYPSEDEQYFADRQQTFQMPDNVMLGTPDIPLALSVQTDGAIQEFLHHPRESFLTRYLAHYQLPENVPKTRFDAVYFGHAFCIYRFPDAALLAQLIRHAEAQKLQCVIEFPPVRTRETERIRAILEMIECVAQTSPEIVANDWGTVTYVSKHTPLACSLGRLLTRHPKDPREEYLPFQTTQTTGLHTVFFQTYLERYHLAGVSLECGARMAPLPIPYSLYLPLYQISTSGNCVLRSLMISGHRGGQTPDQPCPRYCTSLHMNYPAFLHMIGVGNTLFGYDEASLRAPKATKVCMDRMCRRIVLDFPWW